MNKQTMRKVPEFLETLGLTEEPMGLAFTDKKPTKCSMPKENSLPTREKETRDEIDWSKIFGHFSCVIGHIWRARRKGITACFSAQNFGCPGAAFWMGFTKPQTETIIQYVSSGNPGWMEGERYCGSPDALRGVFEQIDPPSVPKPYCVIQPLSFFPETQPPELVIFFARPESLSGLHQHAFYVTDDPEVVVSPWSSACGSIVAWPMRYLAQNKCKAVLGGWDPSARKFFKTDELSFTVPFAMFKEMIEKFEESFLTTKTWEGVGKKILRSKKAWKERE